MHFSKIGTFFVALLMAGSTTVSAQDLIARQAPVDKKLKSIDSLALKHQIAKEVATYTASNLYTTWNNDYVHVYGKTNTPGTFRIDLRNFTMPTPSRLVTSKFGYRPRFRRQHNGLDIKVYVGDTIYAAFDGKIRVVKYERGGYGNYIVIRHNNGLETIYGHLSKWLVDVNEEVRSGQPIGLGGNTGRSFGSHLHFETRLLGVAINPEFMFDFPNQDVTGDFYVYHGSGPVSSNDDVEYAYEESSDMPGTAGMAAPATVSTASNTTPKASSSSVLYHKVRKGDTLYRIANENGITIDKLCQLNGLSKRTTLRPGQVLRCS